MPRKNGNDEKIASNARTLVLLTLTTTFILVGSLTVLGSQEMCEVKNDIVKQKYSKYAITESLY